MRIGAWTATTLGVVILLVSTAAASAGAATATTVTYKAPYSGAETTLFGGASSGCGISATFPVYPSFNATNGHALESVKLTAHSCGAANSSANIEATAGFTSATFAPTAGFHHLTANWVLKFSVSLAATPGGGAQQATAFYDVYEGLQLEDLTTGTTVFQNYSPFWSLSISTGTYAQSFSKVHLSTYLNTTFVTGNSYRFYTYVTTYPNVFVTTGSSSASASVNLGSGGKDAVLSSVTIA